MRLMPTILVLFVLCAVAHSAETDPRRAQVAAATSNALAAIESKVLAASITPDLSVHEFIDRTDSHALLAKTIGRAEQIGGTRWLDDKTCQVRMELPGTAIADLLGDVANTKSR